MHVPEQDAQCMDLSHDQMWPYRGHVNAVVHVAEGQTERLEGQSHAPARI